MMIISLVKFLDLQSNASYTHVPGSISLHVEGPAPPSQGVYCLVFDASECQGAVRTRTRMTMLDVCSISRTLSSMITHMS